MDTISFASFNLYNYQITGKYVYRHKVTAAEYKNKKAWIVSMLKKIDADVIAFQELWTWECLTKAFTEAGLADDYTLLSISDAAAPTWRGISVAMAVRKPWRVAEKTTIKKFPFTQLIKQNHDDDEDDELKLEIDQFSRTIIKATIEKGGKQMDVYAAHLKAKLPTEIKTREIAKKHHDAIGSAISTIRRTAEAAALRWELTNAMKGNSNPVVVIGDLNDDPHSNTLSIITEQPIMTTKARGADTALYSTLMLEQLKSFRDVFYSHEYKNAKDTLDHILVSKEFFEFARGSKWRHTETQIWNDFIGDEDGASSDHGIIKASFASKR